VTRPAVRDKRLLAALADAVRFFVRSGRSLTGVSAKAGVVVPPPRAWW
jgi:hypothetical protein